MCFGCNDLSGLDFLLAASILEGKECFLGLIRLQSIGCNKNGCVAEHRSMVMVLVIGTDGMQWLYICLQDLVNKYPC